MITDTLKEIASTRSKLEALEKKAASEREKKLANLHTELGFESREELIAALRSVGGPSKRGRKKSAPKKAGKAGAAKKRGKRARITPKMREDIVGALKSGNKGTDVAKQFGISLPSLQNIKKAAGLTKSRK